ncbi:DUF2169 domain-containing protein [Colwellia sp. D2M02]|uniref:DUF2169 family type VI secretion system accessory protein n=1 Tax=Colwellia sp. D2M02 TaxID=2841562 RepID=UPI001C09DE61|nr:DUF2169 domain-containing protein [Colwellia sp. D2M02]MBU2894389.1 DUF2169 domain-containing protein [Colwellia sp. D2M02]
MLHNLSPWQATTVENWLHSKQKCLTLIVKQSFEYDDNGNVYAMEKSEEIVMADAMLAEPTTSSLKLANEAVAFKKGFELYGNLTAYPPKAKQAKVIEVYVALTQDNNPVFNKTLRVTGERFWQQSLLGKTASDPKPLKPTALSYENTYGGIDPEKSDKMFPENPAGKGFRVKNVKGSLLPKIEYPAHFLKHPKKEIPPASYGALPLFWQPRLALLPEIDQEALMAGEYPYQGKMHESMFNCAPVDQQLNINFTEQLTLTLKGVSPNKDYHHLTQIKLPYLPPQVAIINGEEQAFIELTCDTLVLDADANTFHLLWRKSLEKNNTDKQRITPYSQIVVQQAKQPNQAVKPLQQTPQKAQGEVS